MRIQFVSNENAVPFAMVRPLSNSGVPTGAWSTFHGSSLTYNASALCNAPANASVGFIPPGYQHDVLVSGLASESLYEYRVGCNGVLSAADARRFVSAPPVGPATHVDFLMFGDMGVNTPFDHTDFWLLFGVEQQTTAPKTLPLLTRYAAEGIPGYNFSVNLEPDVHRRLARRFGGSAQRAAQVKSRLIMDVGDIVSASKQIFFSQNC